MLQTLLLAVVYSSTLLTGLADPRASGRSLSQRQQPPGGNTSALPPGWSGQGQCWEDFGFAGPLNLFLLGPSFVDNTSMTIELCVEFCDQQNNRLAGIEAGNECHCGNMFNPDTGFESVFGECVLPCVGNAAEGCGGPNTHINIFQKDDGHCNDFFFSGEAKLTSGPWRFSYYYNDTVGARALPHNAVDLHPSLKRGNLTVEACVNACGAAGFLLAGVEYADECYCGNALEHNSQPLQGCFNPPPTTGAMICKGNPLEFCGGPNLIYVYTLPGTNLQPLIPFGSMFDNI